MRPTVIPRSARLLITALLLALLLPEIDGFMPTSSKCFSSAARRHHSRRCMFNVFGPFGDFLNYNRNNSNSNKINQASTRSNPNLAAGTFRLLKIPVRDIKPGALRLFLMFYFMGLQNTPDPKTWKADQPSTEEFVVDFWFHDQSAVLSVEMSDDSVTIDRVGSYPSQQYLMQEAVILQGVLDELDQMAHDDNVAVKDRLLILKQGDAIERARDALAFG